MALLAGVNLVLSTLSEVPTEYYEIFSVVSAAFPVIWSQILDATKSYQNDQTPESSIHTLELDHHYHHEGHYTNEDHHEGHYPNEDHHGDYPKEESRNISPPSRQSAPPHA